MDLGSNTVLVTGGGSGIGLALASRFLRAGSEVVVCGRREHVLQEAQEAHPGLRTRACDVATPEGRADLARWVVDAFPGLNVLVNNAGIQRRVAAGEPEPWEATHQEIAVNLDAPIHLTRLLLPHLRRRRRAAVVNVTSGLAFAPLATVPVYCATKAALRSFTLSLRHDLAGSGVEVVEVIPPGVDTDLGGPGLHTWGEPVDAFADAVMEGLAAGEAEIAYGTSAGIRRASREELDQAFARMNGEHG